MNKLYVLAAFLGLAASRSVASWDHGDTLVNEPDFLVLSYDLKFDFGYGSHYAGADANKIPSAHSETYGVHLYSYVSATIDTELFKHYKHQAELEFVPLYFTPYQQTVMWSRVDQGDSMALETAGSRNLVAGEFTVTITENMKTFEVSAWDIIEDGRDVYPTSSDWGYDQGDEYEHEYVDPYYSFNLFDKLNINDIFGSLYGYHNYYTATII